MVSHHLLWKNFFQIRENHYNLRNFRELQSSIKNSVNFGLETVSYRSAVLWSLVTEGMKSETSLEVFKSKIKNWQCDECPCRLCRQFVTNLGFIN